MGQTGLEPLLAQSEPFSTIEGAEGEVRVGSRTNGQKGEADRQPLWHALPSHNMEAPSGREVTANLIPSR